MRLLLLCLSPLFTCSLFASVWVSDLQNKTYQNPVLYADYSDPDVIRVGSDFYMTASSFNCVPGLPILQSRDLVNWKLIGHAVQRLPEDFNQVLPDMGVWAPSIRYHDHWYWIFFGDPDRGIYMTKARFPQGPWSPLHLVKAGKGLIDACPLWDDNGKAWLVHGWAKSRAGINAILTVNELSPDGTKVLDDGVVAIDGSGGRIPTLEGPKFYKRNGYYYILAPAGGVRNGWQMAFRAKSPTGPYEEKRVLEQGSTEINGPHQGGWVEQSNGDNWFLHFQELDGYGRVVHLNPLQWVDDWPVIGHDYDGNGVGEPLTTYRRPTADIPSRYITGPAETDEFSYPRLGLQWQWPANPQIGWVSLTDRPGWLNLGPWPRQADKGLFTQPNLLLQKLPAPALTATTLLELDSKSETTQAGLVIMGSSQGALLVSKKRDGLLVQQVNATRSKDGVVTEMIPATAELPDGPVWLRVTINQGPECQFSYSIDGDNFTPFGTSFTASSSHWVGAKMGLTCIGEEGQADFDYFRVEPNPLPHSTE